MVVFILKVLLGVLRFAVVRLLGDCLRVCMVEILVVGRLSEGTVVSVVALWLGEALILFL